MTTITVRDIDANGMTFRCREAGEGEPVILLHGFPETSHMWTDLVPRLADAGYRCLAPDQRGYSPGARPEGAEHYRYEDVASDVIALAGAWCGGGRFHLIGHDWGALCGWVVVDLYPDRVASWTALSVPHAKAFALGVRDDPEEEPYRQVLKLFLTPGAFEAAAAASDYGMVRNANAASSPEQVEDYLSVFRQPGAMTAALNWYRAARGHARSLEDSAVPFGPVSAPTLFIWGKDDPWIRRMCVDLAAPYMRGPYRVLELEAGHWLAQERPEEVAGAVLEHLRANSARVRVT